MDAYPDNFKNGPPCCPTCKVNPHSTHIAFAVGLMLGGILGSYIPVKQRHCRICGVF